MVLAGALAAVAVAGAGDDAAGRERRLLAVLQSGAPAAEKAITCKRLALCGSGEAVPALAPLLADPQLASWARIALEAIPDPAADAALCQALGSLRGRLLVGAINSLGVRRPAAAVPALARKLGDPDPEVAAAAAVALGRIGGETAAGLLEPLLATAPAGVRPAVAEGGVLCAERLLADGKAAAALALYEAVRAADASPPRTLEATRGAILARGAAGIPLLLEQLRSPDKASFRLGLRVARELPGPEVTAALAAEWDRCPPERREPLLLALADRGGAAAVPVARQALREGTAELQAAAIGVLERSGDPAAVPALVAAATGAAAAPAEAAKLALGRLPGPAVDAAALGLLESADPAARRTAAGLVAQRRVAGAVPALTKAAGDPDPAVAVAAIRALGELAGDAELPWLAAFLTTTTAPAAREAAEQAAAALCTRQAAARARSIVIRAARYGDLPNGPSADVTAKVAALAKGGALAIEASNRNFGDPAGGVVKRLRIDYTVDGAAESKTVAEGETLALGTGAAPAATVDALCAALAAAPAAAQPSFLRLLRVARGAAALAAVRDAATGGSPELRDAAVPVLCDWPTPDALPELTRLAKESTDLRTRILALRGAIRLIPLQDAPPARMTAALAEALAAAPRNEEKKLALAALGGIATTDALALATGCLTDPGLREEACLAAVAVAEKMASPRPAAVAEAMARVAAATANPQLATRARAAAGR